MKMTTQHYEDLKTLIDIQLKRIGEETLKAVYVSLAGDPRVKSQRSRFVWDVFYCVPPYPRSELMQKLYDYLNDTHIETALEKIVPHF